MAVPATLRVNLPRAERVGRAAQIRPENPIESNRIESNLGFAQKIESNRIESGFSPRKSNRIESSRIESSRLDKSNRPDSIQIESNMPTPCSDDPKSDLSTVK